MTLPFLVLAAAVAAGVLVAIPMLSPRAEPMDTEREQRWLVAHAPHRLRSSLRLLDRRVAGGALVALSFGIVFGAALIVGWVFDTIDEQRGVARWDESAAEWGAEHATDASTRILDTVTQLGGTMLLLPLMAVVGLVPVIRHRRFGPLTYLMVVGVGVVLINNGLKLMIDRDRPDIAQLTGHGGSSFPSGHSAAAAACWAAILLVLTRRRSKRVRAAGAVLAVLIAVGVAASRVLLGVHWVSDVVAGVVVGWAWFGLVTIVFGGRLLRLGEPAERATAAETDGETTIDHDVDHDLAIEAADDEHRAHARRDRQGVDR